MASANLLSMPVTNVVDGERADFRQGRSLQAHRPRQKSEQDKQSRNRDRAG